MADLLVVDPAASADRGRVVYVPLPITIISRAAYDAIPTPDPSTVYIITP